MNFETPFPESPFYESPFFTLEEIEMRRKISEERERCRKDRIIAQRFLDRMNIDMWDLSTSSEFSRIILNKAIDITARHIEYENLRNIGTYTERITGLTSHHRIWMNTVESFIENDIFGHAYVGEALDHYYDAGLIYIKSVYDDFRKHSYEYKSVMNAIEKLSPEK